MDDKHEITAFNSFCNITNPFLFMDLTYDKYQNSNPNNIVNDDLLNEIKELIKKTLLYLFNINISDCLKKSFDWNENISILYYTTEIDHFNHVFGKRHIFNILQMYITEKMIIKLIEWIDIHDEYALIISSDHGGQEFFGEDALTAPLTMQATSPPRLT